MTSDIHLLLRQISEEESHSAFERLYRIYFRKCFSFAMYYLKSTELAEETVSDVFLNFWQNRTLLANIKDWDSYLYISVRNQAFLYLNKEIGKQEDSINSFIVEIDINEDNPESALLKQELTEVIQHAVDQLPEKCKMIYQMIREDGLSYKQVSNILEISERTVNTQMTIAIKKIKAVLNDYFQNG